MSNTCLGLIFLPTMKGITRLGEQHAALQQSAKLLDAEIKTKARAKASPWQTNELRLSLDDVQERIAAKKSSWAAGIPRIH